MGRSWCIRITLNLRVIFGGTEKNSCRIGLLKERQKESEKVGCLDSITLSPFLFSFPSLFCSDIQSKHMYHHIMLARIIIIRNNVVIIVGLVLPVLT